MSAADHICHACQQTAVRDILDCGPQPISNRFLSSANDVEEMFPLVLGQCNKCGLLQISHPVPAAELRARHDWISYNEPDGHLDALVSDLAALPGITPLSRVGTVVFGGDTTNARFRERGFENNWRVDLHRDLGEKEPCAGTETIQARLTPAVAQEIIKRHGLFDLLVVRHVVEHAQNIKAFLAAIQSMLRPGGYAVFEVPDCERPFDELEYSILWEEHVFYFTPPTFRHTLTNAGFEVLDLQRPRFSLVAIAQKNPTKATKSLSAEVLSAEFARAGRFARELPFRRAAVVKALQAGGKTAFFGAGHQGCMYINLLGLKSELAFVMDDHPKKQKLFMPGSHLPILPSTALTEAGVRTCLSSLGVDTDQKVAVKNPGFLTHGGEFVSIFTREISPDLQKP
jgi:SAM-dependent methyltransferase